MPINKAPTTPEAADINAAQLVAQAIAVRQRAYAPYSGYPVGAAVLADDGRIYTGCNVENAVYPLTMCAERVAVVKALSEGARHIVAVAVATANGGTPCGACRQVLCEFGAPEMPVFIARLDGSYRQWTLAGLLPAAFSAIDLETSSGQGSGEGPPRIDPGSR
ncbi:MAG TPA: cytidine deaminase [Anaerolineae bacterium]|nr:cytidine deaminase [Anaerolineae bacterium]HQH39505.1 cytidine deaminase [Anaerolineae bacterium]